MVRRLIRIPEGTQSGAQFKLRNLGVPEVNSRGRGDLFVHIDVQSSEQADTRTAQAV